MEDEADVAPSTSEEQATQRAEAFAVFLQSKAGKSGAASDDPNEGPTRTPEGNEEHGDGH
jgi:hypothetical protein